MAFHLLKLVSVGMVATLILSAPGAVLSGSADLSPQPTKAHPLFIDLKNRQVLVYAEVNGINWNKPNSHWGVVYRGGKLSDKAILFTFCTPAEFHDALLQIGARPGNNLILSSSGEIIEGDELRVSVTWPGLSRPLDLADILEDSSGKGFRIHFGGNRQRAVEEQTGCITCLESCPIGITSNAVYPAISSWKRFFSPNSLFKGKTGILPVREGDSVILIYRLIPPKPL